MSTEMFLFVGLAAAMLAFTVFSLTRAAGRSDPVHRSPAHAEGARAALQAQSAQLDRELSLGHIDAQEHARSRDELLQRVLDEASPATKTLSSRGTDQRPWLLWSLPLVVSLGYVLSGQPGAIDRVSEHDRPPLSAGDEDHVQDMIAQMARELERATDGDPAERASGWALLAQAYASTQRFDQAAHAYGRASELMPQEPGWLADRADMLAMTQAPGALAEVQALLQQALRLDPAHLKALAMAGSVAWNRQDPAAALGYWQRARAVAPEGSAWSQELDRSLAAAQAQIRQRTARDSERSGAGPVLRPGPLAVP